MSKEPQAKSHTLGELLKGKPEAVTVRPNDKAITALDGMGQNYSQLPVIDSAQVVRGLITYDSIMWAMRRFNCGIQDLLVSAAMIKAEKRSPDDDIFDALSLMEHAGSVVIVDGQDRLLGIITHYDVTDYFRRRAEDMMLVEDIETMVRDLILYAFSDGAGGIDNGKLEAAIRAIDSQREALHKQFKKGLAHYLQNTGCAEATVNPTVAKQSFSVMAPEQKAKEFEQLTLAEFIELLCSKDRWAKVYQPIFGLTAEHVRGLLDRVREIRNGLAHFRHDITDDEHEALRFCRDWLSNHMPGIPVGWPVTDGAAINIEVPEEADVEETIELGSSPITKGTEPEVAPIGERSVEEIIEPGESRYARLAIWLSKQHGRKKEVQLTFDEIEGIIGDALPPSARYHRAWWANDSVSHPQSIQWLDAGWRVSYLNLSEQRVTFVRTAGRQRAYIGFFSSLLEKLRQDGRTPIKGLSPGGPGWYVVSGLTIEGREMASLCVSFASKGRIRVELYIDTGDQARNKKAFDLLHAQAQEIEAEFGEGLSWERLDEARASRVACYREGSILHPANHEALQAWAVEMLARFQRVIVPAASEALRAAVTRAR